MFKGTLRENMTMAKIDATDEQIYACLEQVNLAQFVRENGGLDMQLLSRGANLSGGQIQRLALARALLHNAELYILMKRPVTLMWKAKKLFCSSFNNLNNKNHCDDFSPLGKCG